MKSRYFKLILPFLIIFSLILSSCVVQQTNTLSSYHDYLLILNSTGNVVLPYDLNTGKFIENPIKVGPAENTNYAPNQILFSEDGNYIYIVNSMDNSITKFTKNLYYVKKYDLPAGTNPYNAFIEGNYIYISGYLSAKVVKLNLTTGTYTESQKLYQANNGIEGIASLDSNYLITININFDSSNYTYGNSIIYILKKDTLEKVKEFELSQNFIGQPLKNFQQVYVHLESDGTYCDLVSTGSYGFSQDSGFLRIKIQQINNDFNITKVCADILPNGEYFGTNSAIYNGYLYMISNSAIYKSPINSANINFTSGIQKNTNVNSKTNLSCIAICEAETSTYIAIINTPWGTPSSFSVTTLPSNFISLNFQNFVEFTGYPSYIIFRPAQ